MTPFEAYRDYIAMVRHFTSDYDYVKYNGKVRVKVATFDARNDKFWFERIAVHHDPHWLLITNLVDNPRRWVGEVARGTELYAARKGRIEALTHTVRRELESLSTDPAAELSMSAHSHPQLIKRYMSGGLTLETATVISMITGCGQLWMGMSDPIMRDVGTRFVKYAAFLKFDRDAMRVLFREHFIDTVKKVS